MAARKKKTTKALVPIESFESGVVPASLADRFEADISREVALGTGSSFWPYLSVKGGVFRFKDELVGDGESVDIVILGGVFENLYYDTPYVEGQSSPPTCFALGKDDPEFTQADMVSHPSAPDRQDEDACSSCQWNAWGSGTGRGKACSNKVRLIAIHADDLSSPKDVGSGQGFRLSVPVTSVAPLGEYQNKVRKGLKRPLHSVVTRATLEPSGSTYKLAFEPIAAINDEDTLDALVAKKEVGQESLLAVPAVDSEVERDAEPKRRSQAGQRKKVPKKAPAKKKTTTRRRTSRKA